MVNALEPHLGGGPEKQHRWKIFPVGRATSSASDHSLRMEGEVAQGKSIHGFICSDQ